MIRVKVYSPIANQMNAWWYWMDDGDGVFSLAFVRSLFEKNPQESDFRFDLHCPGGEVEEGFAIYDYLRTSGKNIYMNIEGICHSMAVTLLLAAPRENRSANPNSVALIHQVSGGAYGSTSAVESQAKDMRMLQNRMLDIYAERTGASRDVLETIMMEEREHDTRELLSLGFISKINSYNTNFQPFNNSYSMRKNAREIKKSAANFLNSIQKLLSGSGSCNYEFVDENGEVLFTTEEESDTLEVGMAASPDGTFTIADGRTVTIADGVITEIQEPDQAEPGDGTENASEEVENLRAENENLRSALAESADIIRDLRSQISSNYQPGRRVGSQAASNRGNSKPTKEERQSAIKEKLNNSKK